MAGLRSTAPGAYSEEQEKAAVAQFPYPSDGTSMPALPAHLQLKPFLLDPVSFRSHEFVSKIAIIRRCVKLRANDIARVPVVWERERSGGKWERIERKPGNVVDVMERANPVDTGFQLMRSWVAFYVGTSSSYLIARRPIGRPNESPEEFWVAPSHLIEVIPGRHRSPAGYLYDAHGAYRQRIDPENVVPLYDWNSEETPVPQSVIGAIEHQAHARYDIPRLLAKLMETGGRPGGYYRMETPPGVTAVKPADPEKIKELEREMNARNTFDAAFKDRILPLLKWERTNLTPDELGILDMARFLDWEIAQAFGVYPWMIGIKSGSGGNLGADKSGSETDVECYVDETVEPDLVMIEGILTERVGPMFEQGIRARFDRSQIPALMERRIAMAKKWSELAGGAIVSVNEARGPALDLEDDTDPESDVIRSGAPAFGPAPSDAPPADSKAPADAGAAKPTDAPAAKARRWAETPAMRKRRANRQLATAERKVVKRFDTIFEKQREKVHAAATAQWGPERAHQAKRLDVNRLLEVDLTDEDAIQQIFQDLVDERGEAALAQIASELDSAHLLANATTYVKTQTARVIRTTTKTTADELRAALATISDSIAEGETYAETVHRVIDEVFDGRAANARTIARTEASRAYNWSGLEAWRQAPEVSRVVWLTAAEGDRHPSYPGLDGQIRDIGEAFDVGGAMLEYPGDPDGPADETINCRCVLEPELDPEAGDLMAEQKSREAFAEWLANPAAAVPAGVPAKGAIG